MSAAWWDGFLVGCAAATWAWMYFDAWLRQRQARAADRARVRDVLVARAPSLRRDRAALQDLAGRARPIGGDQPAGDAMKHQLASVVVALGIRP